MAVLSVTINGKERQIDTDDMTIGFYEDLEQAQATGKMRDFIPVLAAMLQIDRSEVREITLRQWKEIAESFARASAVPPTSA